MPTRPFTAIAAALCALLLCASPALAQRTLREYARLRGQNEYRLQGLGLVIGLPGTGDSGKELVVARPLAEALRRLGNPIPDFDEMAKSKSVALVMVTVVTPRAGAEPGDPLDVDLAVVHSATSLEGGLLLTTPLTSPVAPDGAVYVMAGGRVEVREGIPPTTARISGGGSVVRRVVTTPALGSSFDLLIDPAVAGWAAASDIASEINQQYYLSQRGNEPVAQVVDARTVRVIVPEAEAADPAAFAGAVLATDISGALRNLPARVIADTRSGAILLTGDVQVSPAVITHKDLTITTTVPSPQPSAASPLVRRNNFAAVETEARDADSARLEDLITAFDQLDVPAIDQIQILQMLHSAGKLHARLIIDGTER